MAAVTRREKPAGFTPLHLAENHPSNLSGDAHSRPGARWTNKKDEDVGETEKGHRGIRGDH